MRTGTTGRNSAQEPPAEILESERHSTSDTMKHTKRKQGQRRPGRLRNDALRPQGSKRVKRSNHGAAEPQVAQIYLTLWGKMQKMFAAIVLPTTKVDLQTLGISADMADGMLAEAPACYHRNELTGDLQWAKNCRDDGDPHSVDRRQYLIAYFDTKSFPGNFDYLKADDLLPWDDKAARMHNCPNLKVVHQYRQNSDAKATGTSEHDRRSISC